MSERLFVALWPSPALRRALATQQAAWTWPAGAAPVAADKLHLTLHFIGAVPAARVAEIAAALWLPCPRGTLLLDRAELWPNGCAVLGASEVPASLARLHAAFGQRLRELALPVESRRWQPHVTLARKAHRATPPVSPTPLRWPFRGCALVRSADGRYTPIARYG